MGRVAGTPVDSRGDTVKEAKQNLQETIKLLFEHASKEEIACRFKSDVFITNTRITVA